MEQRQNDFSKGSISRNSMSLALPMTAAQLVNVLYRVVDRIYLGHLPDSDSLALTGLGVSMPIVSILMGFANLCGAGGAPVYPIQRGSDGGLLRPVLGCRYDHARPSDPYFQG